MYRSYHETHTALCGKVVRWDTVWRQVLADTETAVATRILPVRILIHEQTMELCGDP